MGEADRTVSPANFWMCLWKVFWWASFECSIRHQDGWPHRAWLRGKALRQSSVWLLPLKMTVWLGPSFFTSASLCFLTRNITYLTGLLGRWTETIHTKKEAGTQRKTQSVFLLWLVLLLALVWPPGLIWETWSFSCAGWLPSAPLCLYSQPWISRSLRLVCS